MALPKFDNNIFFAHIVKSLALERLEEFRQYTIELESKFNIDKKKLSSAYDKATKGLSKDEIREVGDYFSDDFYMIEEIHIGLYRKSTLVSLYSFLENSLNKLCRNLCARHKYPVKLEDIKGEGIVRAKDYLEKLAKVDFSPLNGEWCNLLSLNRIRNCIVHCEGNIKSSNNTSKLKNIINNHTGLSLRSDRDIRVEREYIDFCITKIEEFLDKLYQQVFPN